MLPASFEKFFKTHLRECLVKQRLSRKGLVTTSRWSMLRVSVGLCVCCLVIEIVAAIGLPSKTEAAPSSSPSALPSVSNVVDPRIVAKAKEWFHRFKIGDIDRAQLDAQVNGQLTDDMIRQESTKLKSLGEPTNFSFLRTYMVGGAEGYDFLLQFKMARVIEMIAFDGDGKIAGIDFRVYVRDQK